jgi:hypothetical protein
MNTIVVAAFVAAVDPLYWAIFKERDIRIPPRGWLQAVIGAVGGAAGAFAMSRLANTTDLLPVVLGGFIGGRLLVGIVATVRGSR